MYTNTSSYKKKEKKVVTSYLKPVVAAILKLELVVCSCLELLCKSSKFSRRVHLLLSQTKLFSQTMSLGQIGALKLPFKSYLLQHNTIGHLQELVTCQCSP